VAVTPLLGTTFPLGVFGTRYLLGASGGLRCHDQGNLLSMARPDSPPGSPGASDDAGNRTRRL